MKERKIHNTFLWILLIMVYFFLFYSYLYNDTLAIIRYEYCFADSFVHGDIITSFDHCFKYFSQLSNADIANYPPNYHFIMNALLGIWGIPMYFFSKLPQIVDFETSRICLMYGKTILAIFLMLSAFVFAKICKQLDIKSNDGTFFFLSSIIVITSVAQIGQSDILGIFFSLLGILAYSKNDTRRFIIWFTIASSFKWFAFFVFIPLLVIKEKSIVKNVGYIFCILTSIELFDLPAILSPVAYENNVFFSQLVVGMLFNNKIPIANGGVICFVLFYGLFLAFCFLHDPITDIKKAISIVPLISMTLLLFSFGANPYWYINISPYLALGVLYCSNNKKMVILFETIGMICLHIYNMIEYCYCYDIKNCNSGLLRPFLEKINYKQDCLIRFLKKTGIAEYRDIFITVVVVCIVVIMLLLLTDKKKDYYIKCSETTMVNIRFALNVLVSLFPILLFIGLLLRDVFI